MRPLMIASFVMTDSSSIAHPAEITTHSAHPLQVASTDDSSRDQ